MSYPKGTADRIALRKKLADEYLLRAINEASLIGLTGKCRSGLHVACGKTRPVCLCICHDEEEKEAAKPRVKWNDRLYMMWVGIPRMCIVKDFTESRVLVTFPGEPWEYRVPYERLFTDPKLENPIGK